ncbi:MAG: hypothetical protein ABIJ53_04845 [Verrucomicrobiota bacterium]
MNFELIFKYPAIFLAGFLVTYLLTPLVRRTAIQLGMVDLPDERRIHSAPTPRGGGVAVFLGFHAACAVIFLFNWAPFSGTLDLRWWLRFLPVSALLLLVGLVDDARGMRALTKLGGQIIAALLLYLSGVRFGSAFGMGIPLALDVLATVIWVLAITNAFNLIDGLDGLATGLAILGSLGLAGSLLLQHLPGDVLICLGLIGACLAFLRYNFHPASVFLGDSGSMFLGFTLATVALSTASKGTALASIGVPLLAMGVPIFDVMLAIWRRSVRRLFGTPEPGKHQVMQADLEHLHHRFVRSGGSQSKAALTLYVISAVLVVVALLSLTYSTHAVGIFLIAFGVGAYVIVKHLARVELWDSASAILSGLRRPTSTVMAVILYPLLDVGILALGFWLAMFLARPEAGVADIKLVWLDGAPLWVGISFLAIFVSGAYRRVWSRSRSSDIVALSVALLMGILLSLGLFSLLGQAITRQVILQTVLYIGLTVPLIAESRLFFRTVQDLMALTARHPTITGKRVFRNIMLYGAGTRCTLFLRQRSHGYPKIDDDRCVVGLLDDEPNLHGRMVYGFKVMGGMNQLSAILTKRNISDIIITADLRDDVRRQLLDIARERHIRVAEWHTEERTLLPA